MLPGYFANMKNIIHRREESHFELPVTMFLAGLIPFYTPCSRLKRDVDNCEEKRQYFRLEQVKHDELIHFYTGFIFYVVFLAFFNLLGPVVNELHYRRKKGGQGLRHRVHMLHPINQLLLTLVKLKLNLKLKRPRSGFSTEK